VGKFKVKNKVNAGVQEAIDRIGSQSELAELCDVAQPSVFHWLMRQCPANRAVQLEEITGVNRSLIRPDLFKRKRKNYG